jgi:hypothetical protein
MMFFDEVTSRGNGDIAGTQLRSQRAMQAAQPDQSLWRGPSPTFKRFESQLIDLGEHDLTDIPSTSALFTLTSNGVTTRHVCPFRNASVS